MKSILSERGLVGILFIMVIIIFSFAQQDSKRMNKMYSGTEPQPMLEQPGQLSSTGPGKNAPALIIVNGQ